MSELFLKVMNMSISASWLVLAVLMLRAVLQKAPKWIHVLLWGIVAVRLICPCSIESAWSLIPSAETFPEKVISGPSFDVQTGIAPIDNQINEYLGDRYFEGVTVPVHNGFRVMTILAIVWGIGMLFMIGYTVMSYWRLHRRVSEAVILRDNIYQSENVGSPFVLGVVKPRIYLPYHMDGQDLSHVVAHEQAHIRRRDHWWKPLGFLLLIVHWFNPLMLLSYILLCRDIELACDEKVIQELDNEQRADYTQALVFCSVNRRMVAACPLAFGEVGVKERVKSVMNYKKPAFWVVVVSVAVCAVVAVCFLTNPTSKNTVVMGANYAIEKVLYAGTVGDEVSTELPLQYCVTADYHLYCQQAEGEDWNYLGVLTLYELTNEELNGYMPVDNMRKDVYDKNGNKLSYDSVIPSSASLSLKCTIESEGAAASIAPAYYPNGFDWEYGKLPFVEMHSSGNLVFTADWDAEELIVSENYYERRNPDATMIHKETYTLVRNQAGEFELDVTYKNPGKEEMAVYFIKGNIGKYVMKINFSQME